MQLSGPKSKKSSDTSFLAPRSPFKEVKSEAADEAWQSTQTGNSIAFLSECQPAVEQSLKSLEDESVNVLSEVQVLKSSHPTFNGRESSYTVAEGKVDGIPVKLALVVFKKNGCNFTISYTARKSTFDSEIRTFDTFLEGFRVR